MVDVSGRVQQLLDGYRPMLLRYQRDVTGDPAALRAASGRHTAQADKVQATASAITGRARALGTDWEAPEYTAFTNKAGELSTTMAGTEQVLRQTAGRLTTAATALTDARTGVDAVLTRFNGQATGAIALARNIPANQVPGVFNYANLLGIEAWRDAQRITFELSAKLTGLFGQNSPPRLSEDEILRRFQVPMTARNDAQWPEGWWGILRSQRMTPAERELLRQLPFWQRPAAIFAFSDAETFALQFYPEPVPHESGPRTVSPDAGHANAFKHAYWSARLAQGINPQWAEDFTTAHETDIGNHPNLQAMDLFNNAVGREIAAANPGASAGELAQRVREAVAQGRMVVIDLQGNLRYSNGVLVGQTGRLPVGTDH